MEAEKEQSWKVRVTAKAKHFNFRFRFAAATNYYASTPTLSFFRFSILLNLRHFILRITSQPIKQQQTSFKFITTTKFIKFFQRFRQRFPIKKKKNRSNVAPKRTTTTAISNLSYLKDPSSRICCWLMMGFLACLVQFISKKNNYVRIVTMIASLGFSVASILLKNFKTVKLVNLAGAATMVCYLFYNFDYNYNYWEYMRRLAWDK